MPDTTKEDLETALQNTEMFLDKATKAIDKKFGAGFSMANPVIVGGYMTALAIEHNRTATTGVADEISNLIGAV